MQAASTPDSERTAMEYDAMGAVYAAANDEGSANAYYERPATIDLIADPSGLRVLDAGCGPGALTEWLTAHGATVTAFDISPEMVRLARARAAGKASIIVADLARPFTFAPDASHDLIVASLALHYIADLAPVLAEFHRVLASEGAVVFSVHHPASDWQCHSRDNYFAIKQVTEPWRLPGGPYEVTFWRRPLTAITQAVSDAGFLIDRLIEPQPLPELAQRDPEEHRLLTVTPSFLFFRLVKRPAGLVSGSTAIRPPRQRRRGAGCPG
jgi:SAM-dependent methyltransferase